MKTYFLQLFIFSLGLIVLIKGKFYNRKKHKNLSNLKPTKEALEGSPILEPYLILPIQWLLSKMPWAIVRAAMLLMGLALMFLGILFKASFINKSIISMIDKYGIAVITLIALVSLVNKFIKSRLKN